MSQESNLTQLIHFLAASFERQSDQILLERFGIGFAQCKILWAMQANPGAGQKGIADYLAQTEASVSRQVKLLRSKGVIETRTNPKNRRQRFNITTPKGAHLRDAALETLDQLSVKMLTGLSIPSKQNLFSLLENTRQSFQKY